MRRDATEPIYLNGGLADQMGAIMLAYGVMTALVARERYGVGQEVNASHLGSMIALQGLNVSIAHDHRQGVSAQSRATTRSIRCGIITSAPTASGSASGCCRPIATGRISATRSAYPSI